jgi:L-ascorbate metabolism protein UlaG (beta-lactamase superfamily)
MDAKEAADSIADHFVDATIAIPMKYGTFKKMPGNFADFRAKIAARGVFTRPGFRLINS